MKKVNSLITKALMSLVVVGVAGERAVSQTAEALGDGDKGAKLGTVIYNSLYPASPLPVLGGDDEALKKTIQNLGAGQHLRDAIKNGATSAAGFEGERQQSKEGLRTREPHGGGVSVETGSDGSPSRRNASGTASTEITTADITLLSSTRTSRAQSTGSSDIRDLRADVATWKDNLKTQRDLAAKQRKQEARDLQRQTVAQQQEDERARRDSEDERAERREQKAEWRRRKAERDPEWAARRAALNPEWGRSVGILPDESPTENTAYVGESYSGSSDNGSGGASAHTRTERVQPTSTQEHSSSIGKNKTHVEFKCVTAGYYACDNLKKVEVKDH
jgi:hypothetical protein